MNKRKVNEAIPFAYDALKECKIATKEGCIDKSYRGQISSFGAAITMGSLLSAVAFFSDRGSAEVDRQKLMDAILYILQKQKICDDKVDKLFQYTNHLNGTEINQAKENIINASIALKLAMNLYTLEDSKKS